jgi:hypothetical protein
VSSPVAVELDSTDPHLCLNLGGRGNTPIAPVGFEEVPDGYYIFMLGLATSGTPPKPRPPLVLEIIYSPGFLQSFLRIVAYFLLAGFSNHYIRDKFFHQNKNIKKLINKRTKQHEKIIS